jgi:hypothetical protein
MGGPHIKAKLLRDKRRIKYYIFLDTVSMYQRSVSIAGFAIGDDKLLRNLNDINN